MGLRITLLLSAHENVLVCTVSCEFLSLIPASLSLYRVIVLNDKSLKHCRLIARNLYKLLVYER